RVLEGMVLDVHGEPLFVRAHRRPLGHGPALQHAVDLQAQIVVEPPRRVLVDDEPAATGLARAAERFRRQRGIPLSPIFLEIAALSTAATLHPNLRRRVANRRPRKTISSNTGVRTTVSRSVTPTTTGAPHTSSRSNHSVQCADSPSHRPATSITPSPSWPIARSVRNTRARFRPPPATGTSPKLSPKRSPDGRSSRRWARTSTGTKARFVAVPSIT